jgi:hypothetical protein
MDMELAEVAAYENDERSQTQAGQEAV